MGLGPILPGRLPGSLIASRLVDNLTTVQNALAKVEQQISSGQRFFSPSEDPAATSIVLVLQRALERSKQFQANITIDQSLLQTTDASLQNLSSAASQAKSLLLSGVGSTSTPTEKQALADQVDSIIQGLLNDANTKSQGRYLFGGSQSEGPPFELLAGGVVRYVGDTVGINSLIDDRVVAPNNVDGVTAFGALSDPVGADVDPAITLKTRLADLNAGRGVQLGTINVTVDNGGPITKSIDLSHAETVKDVKSLIEGAFAPGTLTVDIVATAPKNALTITPAAGTVAIADVTGGRTAADLGIASSAAASIQSADLDPRLTLDTPLSAFNGGAGATLANGLFISNGSTRKAVDISTAVTVEDLFNLLKAANVDLDLHINAAGNGLAIATRLSGADFSIGENGGSDADSLGIRTFTGSTLLSGLNHGAGVPVNNRDQQGNLLPALLVINRRDGTTANVDLKGAATVQEVLDRINAVDPTKLVASLNAVGNGISIVDNDGASTGPLTIPDNDVSRSLGLNGTDTGTDPTVPIVGREVNYGQANGIFNVLTQLSRALRSNDNTELTRLQPLLDKEADRISLVRGKVGSRQQLLESVKTRLADENVNLKSSLSDQLDVDMADAVTRLSQLSTSLQAALQITAQSLKTSLFNYI